MKHRRGNRLAIAAVSSLVACSGPPILPLAPPTEATSWVFAIQALDEPRSFLAVGAAEQGALLERFVAGPAHFRVHALAYDVGLDALGLAPGAVPEAAACARRCEITAPRAAFVLDYTGGGPSGWLPASPIDEGLLDRLVPDRKRRCGPPCLSLSASRTDFDLGALSGFLLPEGLPAADGSFDSALLGLITGAVYRVRGPGQTEPLCGPAHLAVTAAAWSVAQDRLWFTAEGGKLGFLRPEQARADQPCPYVVTATLPAAAAIHRLGNLGGDPEALVTLSSTGAIGIFDGRAFHAIGNIEIEHGVLTTNKGFVVPFAGAAFVGAGGNQFGIVRDGRLELQTSFPGLSNPTGAMSAAEFRGDLLVCLDKANLFQVRNDRLVGVEEGPVSEPQIWDECAALGPMRGHLVVSLNHGLFGQWSPEAGYGCPLSERLTFENAKRLLPVRGSLVGVDSDDASMEPYRVLWISAQPEACL